MELKERIQDYVRRNFYIQGRVDINKLVEEIEKFLEEDGLTKNSVREMLNEVEREAVWNLPFRPSKKQERLNRLNKLRSALHEL